MDAPNPYRHPEFHDLMPHRVREVLLVSSLYDAFVLQEDGHLSEQVFFEYRALSLSSAPGFTHVTTGEAALQAMGERRFDLVLVVTRLPDMDVVAFARAVKERHPRRAVVVLAVDNADFTRLAVYDDDPDIDGVFAWNGDAKILLAIVKSVEDRQNVDHDIDVAGVRVILVVEDSIRYSSAFLSAMYPALMEQSQALFSEGLNRLQRLMRMRSRPKLLLARSYEQALALYERYRDNLIAIVSDVGFPRDGELDPEAGLRLLSHVREESPLLPTLLQSAETRFAASADELCAHFVAKGSTTLLAEIHRFLETSLGFGPFIFRRPDGEELQRAHDIQELEDSVRTVPPDSLVYHAQRNEFSNWLMARSEFGLAEKLQPQKWSDFGTPEGFRAGILAELAALRHASRAGVVSDFVERRIDRDLRLQRIGMASMGGKARGLAFLNQLLSSDIPTGHVHGLRVSVPLSFVLTTDAFDEFLVTNGLSDIAYQSDDENEILSRFLDARLSAEVRASLDAIVQGIEGPLAVRASSLLEDNMLRPFAGIYGTVMLANSGPDLERRQRELYSAVAFVYASMFSRDARAYVAQTHRRLEEEKMAVLIQEVVGRAYGARCYPILSGVARAQAPGLAEGEPAPGVTVDVVLGLGHAVVSGGPCLRLHPQRRDGSLPRQEVVGVGQTHVEALDMTRPFVPRGHLRHANIVAFPLDAAREDGVLDVAEVDEGTGQPTIRGFSPFLADSSVPFVSTLEHVTNLAREGVGMPIELEFALALGGAPADPSPAPVLYLLQLRPVS